MSRSMSSQTPTCDFHDLEIRFVQAIPPALIREAKHHGVTPADLLFQMLQALSVRQSLFGLHLVANHDCIGRMEELLTVRFETVDCLDWTTLLHIALGLESPISPNGNHVARCAYCETEIQRLKQQLPNLREFSPR